MSDTEPAPRLIFDKILALRAHIGGLVAKEKPKVPYLVRSAKELMIKVRAGLDELELLAFPVRMDLVALPVHSGTCASCNITIRILAKDGSFLDFCGGGTGAATDDKGGGKASTYAWKDAFCKGLDIPDAEMVDTDDEDGVPVKRFDKDNPPKTAKPEETKPAVSKFAKAPIDKAPVVDAIKEAFKNGPPNEGQTPVKAATEGQAPTRSAFAAKYDKSRQGTM